MRAVGLLLGKDLRVLGRSSGLLAALVLYPLLVALIVGLVVRYAGDRPRLALVDEDGLPSVIVVGDARFDVKRVFDRAAEDVDLVRLSLAEANRELANGDVLGIVEIPAGFQHQIRGMIQSPAVLLRTTESALATRIVEKVQALVFAVNQELQQAYIKANLTYVNLLLNGGHGSFLGNEFDVIGLQHAAEKLDVLAQSTDPTVASEARDLANFVRQAKLALANTGESLRATAHPILLKRERSGGRALLLSGQIQAYAIALTLGFIALLVSAAAIAAERDENVIGRFARGLVRLGGLVVEKVAFTGVVAGGVGFLLGVIFGLVVEIGNIAGGEPWQRLPLVLLGVLLGGLAFGALGVLIGVLAREARAATLIAFLVALPILLLGLVPSSVIPSAGWVSDAFPFIHTARLLTSALANRSFAGAVARESGWLVGLGLVFALAARLSMRRLLT
jgi:hypothetical protein